MLTKVGGMTSDGLFFFFFGLSSVGETSIKGSSTSGLAGETGASFFFLFFFFFLLLVSMNGS